MEYPLAWGLRANEVCSVAWIVLAVLLPVLLLRIARDIHKDLAVAGGLALAALLLRLALPWGPLNFADSERLRPLWSRDAQVLPVFASVASAMGLLRHEGFSVETLLRMWAPIMGALGVASTYAAARALKLEWRLAAVAALLVAASPAHAHYSTGPALSVETGALAAAAFALAVTGDRGFASSLFAKVLAIPLLAALVVLVVYARPEWRLFVVPIAILVSGPAWSWPGRISLAAFLAVPLALYLPIILRPDWEQAPANGCGRTFLVSFLFAPLTFGLVWCIAAARGLWAGNVDKRTRIALGALFAAIGGVYLFRTSDPSPQWGQWRYWVSLFPFVALCAAPGLDVWMRRFQAKRVLAVCGALVVLQLGLSWRTLHTPNNEQAAFAFVRDTAQQAARQSKALYVLVDPESVAESAAVLGLSAALNDFDLVPRTCDHFSLELNREVRAIDPRRCADWEPQDGGLVFLGPQRNPEFLDPLKARFTLEPVIERSENVVADCIRDGSRRWRCSSAKGLTGPDFLAQLGWYRLHRRP